MTDRQVILDKYYDNLKTNISPEFVAACPEVITFMKSDVALSVFCPIGWHGISGLEPLKLEFSKEMPARYRPPARHVRPQILEAVKKEFDTLRKYMYVPSVSPIASPLVIAPRPTPPFYRFCGDYVKINKYIKFIQSYIPIVIHELNKAAKGKYFIDADMTRAFHQITLDIETSLNLSVMTTWGCFCPLYMPEGIPPATGILNTVMTDILSTESKHTIVIFDNFLSICYSHRDCYNKLVRLVNICHERRVVLGMAKTKIGFNEATFFGYRIKDGTYQLTQSRKDAVTSLVMPSNIKQMQSFLGCTVFFNKNIVDYSQKAAPLHDMCTKSFNWDKTTWKLDYLSIFESFKNDILNSIAVSFPNYELPFILRTDASDIAWGGVLLQVLPGGEYECIGLTSAKFSDSAKKWDIHKKEAWGIIGSLKSMEYTLRGKYFICETDNKNIIFLEQNTTPIVIRWRMFMQTFYNCRRFLNGKYNKLGDWLSRQYYLYRLLTDIENDNNNINYPTLHNIYPNINNTNNDKDVFFEHVLNLLVHTGHEDEESSQVGISSLHSINQKISLPDMFYSCHGGRNFHRGVKATYQALNEKYPGHVIPIRIIKEMIEECPTCQKVRIMYEYNLPEEKLNLKCSHSRQRIGVDTLTITPKDKYGNSLAIVIVEHFTKFVSIYPTAFHTAEETAKAMFLHYTRYGKFEEVISDPGSDFMSSTVVLLNRFLGQEKLVSLVDRHESNGVEPTNKKILAFIRTLAFNKRIANQWSDPIIINLIQYQCNILVHSETNFSPMELKFGSHDLPYMLLPEN